MALQTIPKLTGKAQTIFNRYIRQRDSQNGYFTCISCGSTKDTSQMDAGHYVPVKNSSALRFDEYNVNGECKACNGFDQFHLIGYRKNLIDKIGERMVLHLESQSRLIKKWTRTELNEINEKYGEINK
jgi:5-methylcytosine-specific restriction endonuclease McrA